jgi:hypothetical protein
MPETAGAAIAAFAGSGTAATVGTAIATSVAGALVSKALAPKQQAQTPAITQPNAPPKAQQAQDPVDIAKKNAAAAAATGQLSGNNSTVLSGPQGVSPGSLNLGQSSLLGQ